MNDPFASGTPWDDGEPIAGDFTAEPVRKAELSAPIFQGKGQRAVKMKQPKQAKPKRDPDDILGERTSRIIWQVLRVQRTVTVTLFIVAVGLFTYSFAVGSNGAPVTWPVPKPLLHALGFSVPPQSITPVLAAFLAVVSAWMIGGIVGVVVARPHGKFHRFTVRALIFAGVAVALDLILGGVLSHTFEGLVTSAATHLPEKWTWLVDPSAALPGPGGAPNTPTPTPSAHTT
ncbi:hypothetical protein [Curtobacterium sp. MCSS17_016]|uniref:hypothetical protein n=1 Tax=Curtobacterium sp. MCSS17_016 TaxID=2175644 RepID=UPI000DA7D300|nr:hypothetical protein [Curtobacterium sp. MCSS17_016]WIE81182.1 hypothetical protein DEJ19_018285 [Curtobacterium sp. MCSS17_016]